MQNLRDSFSRSRHSSPNSRVRFAHKTTESADETADTPSTIAFNGSDSVNDEGNQLAFAGHTNADTNIASHLNPANNASGYSSLTASSSELFKKLFKSAYTFDIEKLKYESDPRQRRENS